MKPLWKLETRAKTKHKIKSENVLGTAMKTTGITMVCFTGAYILYQTCLKEEGQYN